MKKTLNLIIRLVVVTVIIIFLFFLIEGVLKIKYSDNLKGNNKEWNWTKENDVIFEMLENKYPAEDNENFMMIINKDDDIPEKADGEKRILVVGDSFAYGYGGTNINYTWWKQLNLIIKEAGYSNVNIYAAGRYFVNTKDELEKILKNEMLMKKVDPDLVIIGYVVNDPEERDETNYHNLIKEEWEINLEEHPLYKKSPVLYYELVDRMKSLDAMTKYDELVELGNLLGFYRWDIRTLMISEGDRLERYKGVLKEVDDYMKKIELPYFYLFLDNIDNPLIKQASNNVYNAMQDLSIKAYYEPLILSEIFKKYNSNDETIIRVNPTDSHPGIVLNYKYGKSAYEILKKDYSFLFQNPKMQDINELKLNINDTMPLLDVKKISDNIFEFEYPSEENERNKHSSFLYYPIEKEYVKLNLEYPKNVEKIIVNGEGLKNVEIYVNTIDKKYNIDINDAYRKSTICEKIGNNIFKVNNKITSISLVANFKENSKRKIRIEFIED